MSDLQISIGAQDEASPAFRAVAASARQLGTETKSGAEAAAKGTQSLTGSILKAQVAYEALRKAGQLALDFIKDGVKGYIAQETATFHLSAAVKQLGYDTNTLTPALANLADQLESETLIPAETVEKVEQLLLQFGVAPRDIKKTTTAILDYSAATGKDAAQSAEMLARALTGGGQQMNAFGLSVGRTGDKTKDLNALVDKMATQFGGSAKAATEGLAGDMGRLQKAQEDLGKALGGFFATVESKYHVLSSLTEALNGARLALTGDDGVGRQERKAELAGLIAGHEKRVNELLADRAKLTDPIRNKSALGKNEQQLQHETQMLQKYRIELAQLQEHINQDIKDGLDQQAALTTEGHVKVGGATETGTKKVEKVLEDHVHELRRLKEEQQAAWAEMSRGVISTNAAEWQRAAEEMKRQEDAEINEMIADIKRRQAEWDQATEAALKHSTNRIGGMSGALSTAMAQSTEQQGGEAMFNAGISVGNAFISGLDQALSETQSGGDFDVGALVASVLPALVTAGIIASTGGAAAPFAPLIGAAAGIIVKQGIGALTPKAQGAPQKKFHSGGWVDLPRYHDGGLAADEHPAILQAGERVLSRNEVAAMGGPSGVDVAASGGGRTAVFVQTFDSLSMRDMAAGRMGTSIVRTTMQGRGEFQMQLARMGFGKRRRS